MTRNPEPDRVRLERARNEVQTFLRRKKAFSIALFVFAGILEVMFFVLMLAFMDFTDRMHWFLFFAVLFVYCPLITFSWRNAVKIDHLFYRVIDELKFDGGGTPREPLDASGS
jgi:hypothetical protein